MAYVVSQNKSHTQAFFERNEYMVDHSDMVIALLDSRDFSSASGGTARTIAYAEQHGKPVITLYARWFEDGWPNINGISVSLPSSWAEMLGMSEK